MTKTLHSVLPTLLLLMLAISSVHVPAAQAQQAMPGYRPWAAQRPAHWDERTGERASNPSGYPRAAERSAQLSAPRAASAYPATSTYSGTSPYSGATAPRGYRYSRVPTSNDRGWLTQSGQSSSVQAAVAWQQDQRSWVDPVGLQWLDPNPGYLRVAQVPSQAPQGMPSGGYPMQQMPQVGAQPMQVGEPDCPPEYQGQPIYPGFMEPDCPAPPMGFMPAPMAPPPQQQAAPPQLPPQTAAAEAASEPYRPLLPPNTIGNLMGTRPQLLTLSVDYAFPVRGTIISGAPGSAGAVLAFEQNGGFPNDFTSIPGTGRDTTGDGFADLFDIAEPLPPNEVPTSPGAGFEYQGGTAAYTNSPTATTPQDGQFMNNELWFAEYAFAKSLEIPAGGALSIRRLHVAENNSPLPSDRVFFDYRFFSQPLGRTTDNHWYTFGAERTFFSGRTSIDARLPFAYTIDGEQYEDDPGMRSIELGNLAFTLKQVFWGTDRWLLSGGTGVSLPTGDETRIFLADGTQVLVIDNDAVHVQPFLGGIWLPNELFFFQAFVQVNLDLQGNDVRGNIVGGRLPVIGTLNSPTTLLADLSGGMWVYSNPSRSGWVQAIALAGELSAETPLEDAEIVSGNGITVSDIARELDQLNATLAAHAYVGRRLALTGGVTLPLRSAEEREFDWSAVFLANWLF